MTGTGPEWHDYNTRLHLSMPLNCSLVKGYASHQIKKNFQKNRKEMTKIDTERFYRNDLVEQQVA